MTRSHLSLPIQVWLASNEDYDFIPGYNTISATSFQKPIRALVITRQMETSGEVDLDALIPSRIGTAIHSALEKAWSGSYQNTLRRLGYPETFIEKIVINPEAGIDLSSQSIPIWIEKRTEKEVGNWMVSGKFDFVIAGQLHDLKTTKVFSYMADSNTENYMIQGSIYRWLNPEIIKEDTVQIDYLFTDWTYLRSLAEPDYPKTQCISKKIPLMSIAETERYIKNKLNLLDRYLDSEIIELPQCTPKELWQQPTAWAYYGNQEKLNRATRVFQTPGEAYSYKAKQGKGIIIERPGQVKRCLICEARSICSQAEQLEIQGLLK